MNAKINGMQLGANQNLICVCRPTKKKDSYLKEKGRNLDLKVIYLSMEKDKTYFDGIMVGVLITILIFTAFLSLVLYNLK